MIACAIISKCWLGLIVALDALMPYLGLRNMNDLPATSRNSNAPFRFFPINKEVGVQHTRLFNRSLSHQYCTTGNPLHGVRCLKLSLIQLVLSQVLTLPIFTQHSTSRLNHIWLI